MLARRLTTILPAMTLGEALDTMRIHRVVGRTGDRTALVTTRPCRAPSYHLGCRADRWGQVPRPGDMSRSHHGILWMFKSLPRVVRPDHPGRR